MAQLSKEWGDRIRENREVVKKDAWMYSFDRKNETFLIRTGDIYNDVMTKGPVMLTKDNILIDAREKMNVVILDKKNDKEARRLLLENYQKKIDELKNEIVNLEYIQETIKDEFLKKGKES